MYELRRKGGKWRRVLAVDTNGIVRRGTLITVCRRNVRGRWGM